MDPEPDLERPCDPSVYTWPLIPDLSIFLKSEDLVVSNSFLSTNTPTVYERLVLNPYRCWLHKRCFTFDWESLWVKIFCDIFENWERTDRFVVQKDVLVFTSVYYDDFCCFDLVWPVCSDDWQRSRTSHPLPLLSASELSCFLPDSFNVTVTVQNSSKNRPSCRTLKVSNLWKQQSKRWNKRCPWQKARGK